MEVEVPRHPVVAAHPTLAASLCQEDRAQLPMTAGDLLRYAPTAAPSLGTTLAVLMERFKAVMQTLLHPARASRVRRATLDFPRPQFTIHEHMFVDGTDGMWK